MKLLQMGGVIIEDKNNIMPTPSIVLKASLLIGKISLIIKTKFSLVTAITTSPETKIQLPRINLLEITLIIINLLIT